MYLIIYLLLCKLDKYLILNIAYRVSTEKQDLNKKYANDISPERSPSIAEEYWSNFNQISPMLISPTINGVPSHNGSNFQVSRTSSRLNAANEILFGKSNSKTNLYASRGASPSDSNNLVPKPDQLGINGGFGSYISQQEQLVSIPKPLTPIVKAQ